MTFLDREKLDYLTLVATCYRGDYRERASKAGLERESVGYLG